MKNDQDGQAPSSDASEGPTEGDLASGSYELIRGRLLEQASALGAAASALNDKRRETFGRAELAVAGNTRVRTENNCVPCDIVQVGGHLLFGYNVFIGLKRETSIADVLSVRKLQMTEGALALNDVAAGDAATAFLEDERFASDFAELYRFYRETRLIQLTRDESKLLAVFQIGQTLSDVRVFRWQLDASGAPGYIDNRGERDHVFPPAHGFEWSETTREDHVAGRHPHISVLDEVFVETVGGNLTIKVEDNTDEGEGVYSEPVEEPNQSLDDADVAYAKLGTLILLRVRPYREEAPRYLVFATRAHSAVRIDAIGEACIELPEDHGIIFPGGYFLQDGSHKVFDGEFSGYEYERIVRSPNGEDVLYVFHRRSDGHYALFPYNLIRKEIQNAIHCHGYSLFADGRMVVFRSTSDDPTRVHPMQLWATPFASAEHAAAQPTGGGVLENIGNAELVRGISDAYSIQRAIADTQPSQQIYEDLIAAVTRCLDSYYWLDEAEVGDLRTLLTQVRGTAELVVDEFTKVLAIRERAEQAVAEARAEQDDMLTRLRPDAFSTVEQFMGALTQLRNQRGRLISMRELRYVDVDTLTLLEEQTVERFDQISAATAEFLLDPAALSPLQQRLEELSDGIASTDRTHHLDPLGEKVEETVEGLTVMSEVVGSLKVEDPTTRTEILERISEVFAQVNRVRAIFQNRKQELLGHEGRAEFAAQFQLFNQSVTSAVSLADTPERCEEQLSRLMLQLEELEARFGEFDEFLGDLAQKREEVYEVLEQKKQQLLDERARRADNLVRAADRILGGVGRRAGKFGDATELNAYFASDPMILKLQELCERLEELGDGTRAEEMRSRLKAAKQEALRGLRDRADLYEDGASVIKLGRHRFAVNTEALELTLLPHEDGLAVSLAGTGFREPVDDEEFNRTRDYWGQQLVSETDHVYRAEYLAATLLLSAEQHEGGLTLGALRDAERGEGGMLGLVRAQAAERFDEGYERGIHDADAAHILEQLLHLRDGAGLLRFAPDARALACLFWAFFGDAEQKGAWQRRARSLGLVRDAFEHAPELPALADELGVAIARFLEDESIEAVAAQTREAGQYLVEELTAEEPRFVVSAGATALRDGLRMRLETDGTRRGFEQDLEALQGRLRPALSLSRAWLEAYERREGGRAEADRHLTLEAAVLLLGERRLTREPSSAATRARIEGLLGQHGRIDGGALSLRLDEFLSRLGQFVHERVPGYRLYRQARQALIERERRRLRLSEYMPRVLSSFVRNKLIQDVYLPVIGDNLAKQLGAAGAGKRTDLMGLLLLISPPGYGKTTLMEYIASRLGLVFMKINGPSLGHGVHSLDPAEAPNATARQEVEKINLAFEMGNNVMLYLDDIQHTHPELLQKFISLCDAQRRVEGVWKGRTRTYDLRGRRFCVVMAGNPYTESGDKFQVPDMLANRADIYNLGDVLGGQDDAFALSYVENALTSNAVLAPLGTREQSDIYLLMRMAQGEEIPATDLSHGYSNVELDEIKAVLQRMFRARDVLLAVNQQYIASAAMDDSYRTEPAFKLQGSYRNMNKLAEKIVAAMNDAELERLIDDHYQGEAQTLTTGAEQNLLKLAELRGTLEGERAERWEQIKRDFRRVSAMGGAEDDPVTRVTGQLGALGSQLEGIRDTLGRAAEQAVQRDAERAEQAPAQDIAPAIAQHLQRLDAALAALAEPKIHVTVENRAPEGIDELLGQQVAIVERTLVPLVRAATQHMAESDELARSIGAVLGITRAIAERIEDIQTRKG